MADVLVRYFAAAAEVAGREEETVAVEPATVGALQEDLVARYSDEPGAARRGGNLGTFRRGVMVPEFEQALEKLAVGALSGVVETPFGFHVILRTQ